MYLFLGDESNLPPSPNQFFIYGGLIFPFDKIPSLHADIVYLRAQSGLKKSESLKFANEKGRHSDLHLELKAKVLQILLKHKVKFLATAVLQQILANKSQEEYMGWAVNAVTSAFHEFLEVEKAQGAMLIDRVESELVNKTLGNMAENFQKGLTFPNNYTKYVDDRVLMFGMTSNNSSHLSSCTDIALGAFRYCVNAATSGKPAAEKAARNMMPLVDSLFWRVKTDGLSYDPTGLRLLPGNLSPTYSPHYQQLRRKLQSYGTKIHEPPESAIT